MIQLLPSGLLLDRKGTGALELAATLPVLIFLLAGMIDMSRFASAHIDAEQAAQRGTDFALAMRPNDSTGEYIRSETANAAAVPISHVVVDIYLECDGVRQSDFNSSCTGGQDQARLVSVTVNKSVATVFDWALLNRLLGNSTFSPSTTARGDSVVRFQ